MANFRRSLAPLILVILLFSCKAKPEAEQATPQTAQYEETIPEKQEEEPTVLQSYNYNWNSGEEMPDLVIIIDDFGNSAGQLLDDFADLPSEIVFAVLPDLPHTRTAANKATQSGHEVIIHIPMEAENSSVSPGDKFIAKGMDTEEIKDILQDFYRQMPMAVAANNHMGSASTADLKTMNSTLSILKSKGLFFIDSSTTSKSAVYAAGLQQNLFTAKRDIFLDVPDSSDDTLADKINSLGKYKGRKEPVIIITHCHNREKLEALQKFIAQVQGMGLRIVSLRDAFPRALS